MTDDDIKNSFINSVQPLKHRIVVTSSIS